jgi:S1-C subfamily serine protease
VDVYSLFAVPAYEKDSNASEANFIDECLESVVTVQTPQAKGSGFVVSEDGLVVTNHHVIEGATDIIVTLHNGHRYFADVLHRSIAKDIAVLRIHVNDLSPVTFAPPRATPVGSRVYAIGAPLGIESTVTSGIVSSSRRMVAPYNPLDSLDYVQTDAAINPGNSGGPLVDERGRVVGMNSWKMSRAEGLGFAISSGEIRRELEIAVPRIGQP